MDIRKSLTTQNNPTAKKGDLAQSLRRSVAPAQGTGLAKPDARTALPTDYKGGGAIGYIIDATGSRQSTWAQAQTIQRTMFDNVKSMGAMQLRLIHFGGGELKDLGWKQDPAAVASAMSAVECESGRS
ncbi:MAG: VWA domain-containing protein, partial [Alphaproteobacteria bacterium]|nr:VWA domain-containing protein [Alphaproteobacteria bacterium]